MTITRSCALSALALSVLALPAVGSIEFLEIHDGEGFAGAVQPGALRYACGKPEALARLFAENGLRFSSELLRKRRGDSCHIFYKPTLPGFRAHTESDPVRMVVLDVEQASTLSSGRPMVGDSADVARQLLSLPFLGPALTIQSATFASAPNLVWQALLRDRDAATRTRVEFRARPFDLHHPWTRDYLMSGEAQGETRVLVPRRSFEGRFTHGAEKEPLLDSLPPPLFVRSQLAWDAGDLLVVRDPRNPARRLLFYGYAATPYWSRDLTHEEYGHVLATEFGADEAIDFGGLTLHLDYSICFLPEHNLALFAEPEWEDDGVSLAMLRLVAATFRSPVPPVLRSLLDLYEAEPRPRGAARKQALRLLNQMEQEWNQWSVPIDRAVYARLEKYLLRECPADPASCLNERRLAGLSRRDPGFLSAWVQATLEVRMAQRLPLAALALLREQLNGAPAAARRSAGEKRRLLEDLGYRVITVPRSGQGYPEAEPWAGISYANSVLIGRTLFVPAFSLGEPEQRVFEKLRRELPPEYRVTPIFARYAMLYNGGLHCMLGLIREQSEDAILPVRISSTPCGKSCPDVGH